METTKNRNLRVCQIGAGLIGRERIKALLQLARSGRNVELSAVYDPFLKSQPDTLRNLRLVGSVDEVFSCAPDWIFISTPHDEAVKLVKQFLTKDFNVLMEKPMGRNLREAEDIAGSQIKNNQLYIGCNYRFYDGITAALRDMAQQKFGRIISVSMMLGHGGNPKDKEGWKLNPQRAGGGVLIDPGIHLLDLCQCMFPGRIKVRDVFAWRGFWNTGIEEEAHVLMQSGNSAVNLQLSVVKWRSTFRIEINGEEGYGIIEGRGRSYGRQRYVRGKRWGWRSGSAQRDTEELVVDTDGDDVFLKETDALLFGGANDLIRPCSGREALVSMELLDHCRKEME